jgi:D-alanine transfer protein
MDHLLYWLVSPLGFLENQVYAAQDEFETTLYILTQRRTWDPEVPRETKVLEWPTLLEEAARQSHELSANELVATKRNLAGDPAFMEAMDRSPEWSDFELLLRTFRELGFEPLVLSIPPEGKHFEKMGISMETLLEYSRRIHTICERYGARVETFDDHIDDRSFLTDHHDHMSVKGWMYYNKALDDYFHRRHGRAAPGE